MNKVKITLTGVENCDSEEVLEYLSKVNDIVNKNMDQEEIDAALVDLMTYGGGALKCQYNKHIS